MSALERSFGGSGSIFMDDDFPGHYSLLNRDTLEFQRPIPESAGLDQMFSTPYPAWIGSAVWLWTTFARPVPDALFSQSYWPSQTGAPAAIERLPNELLDQIFEYIQEDEDDALVFGLSSSILWSYVGRRVQQEHARSVVMWAGQEVGFYLTMHDCYGTGCMHPVHLEGSRNRGNRVNDAYPGFRTNTSHRWIDALHKARTTYERYMSRGGMTAQQEAGTADAIDETSMARAGTWGGFSENDWNNIEHDLFPCMYPQDRVWVLRNLSLSEFVRSDKLQPSARKVSGKGSQKLDTLPYEKTFTSKLSRMYRNICFDTSPLTFAQIFMVLACSSGYFSWQEQVFGFDDGRWNGHRFDIVPLATHIAETTESEWVDVSELAVNEVANLRYRVQHLTGRRSNRPKSLSHTLRLIKTCITTGKLWTLRCLSAGRRASGC